MARIRLRHCYVRFIDGYTAAATVNGAHVTGATTLAITTAAGIIPAGTRFTIVGAAQIYTVLTAIGDPNTTSITFSPAFLTADGIPAAGAAIVFQGRSLNVKVGDGNLTWDSTRNIEYEMDRGLIDAVVQGDDVPLDVKLDMVYEFLTAITGAGTPTPEDVIKHRGEAANWLTAGADPCEKYAIKIEVDYAPPCAIDHEITTFPEFRWDSVSHDISQASLSLSGKCKVTDVTTIRRAY